MTEAVENQAWDQIRIIFQDFRIAPSRLEIITSIPELLHKHGKISAEQSLEMSDLVIEIFGENGISPKETSKAQKKMMSEAMGEIDVQIQLMLTPPFSATSAFLSLVVLYAEMEQIPHHELGEELLGILYP